MFDYHTWIEIEFETGALGTHTVVDIFEVQEVALVHESHHLKYFPLDEYASKGEQVVGARRSWQCGCVVVGEGGVAPVDVPA